MGRYGRETGFPVVNHIQSRCWTDKSFDRKNAHAEILRHVGANRRDSTTLTVVARDGPGRAGRKQRDMNTTKNTTRTRSGFSATPFPVDGARGWWDTVGAMADEIGTYCRRTAVWAGPGGAGRRDDAEQAGRCAALAALAPVAPGAGPGAAWGSNTPPDVDRGAGWVRIRRHSRGWDALRNLGLRADASDMRRDGRGGMRGDSSVSLVQILPTDDRDPMSDLQARDGMAEDTGVDVGGWADRWEDIVGILRARAGNIHGMPRGGARRNAMVALRRVASTLRAVSAGVPMADAYARSGWRHEYRGNSLVSPHFRRALSVVVGRAEHPDPSQANE